MFTGIIIKETLTDELVLDYLTIDNVEIWKTTESIKYWTMIFFNSENLNFPDILSKYIIEGWFADMKTGKTKYVVFRNTVLKYEIGNAEQKEEVLNECRLRGIPNEQLNWSE